MKRFALIGAGAAWAAVGSAADPVPVSVYPPPLSAALRAAADPAPTPAQAMMPSVPPPALAMMPPATPAAGCTTCGTTSHEERGDLFHKLRAAICFRPGPSVIPRFVFTPYRPPLRAYFPCREAPAPTGVGVHGSGGAGGCGPAGCGPTSSLPGRLGGGGLFGGMFLGLFATNEHPPVAGAVKPAALGPGVTTAGGPSHPAGGVLRTGYDAAPISLNGSGTRVMAGSTTEGNGVRAETTCCEKVFGWFGPRKCGFAACAATTPASVWATPGGWNTGNKAVLTAEGSPVPTVPTVPPTTGLKPDPVPLMTAPAVPTTPPTPVSKATLAPGLRYADAITPATFLTPAGGR